MDPSFKNEEVFNLIPLNPPLSGWSFAFGSRLSVNASFPPGAARAEHFAGVFQRGIGDVFSAGHAG